MTIIRIFCISAPECDIINGIIFDMEARGIDKETAKKIMVRARLDSVARMIPDEDLKNKVALFLDQIL